MTKEKYKLILDLLSPLTSGVGALCGLIIFHYFTIHYIYEIGTLRMYILLLIIPTALALILSTCIHNRKYFFNSIGSIGAAIGAFISTSIVHSQYLIFSDAIYNDRMGIGCVTVAIEGAIIVPISTILASYYYHKWKMKTMPHA